MNLKTWAVSVQGGSHREMNRPCEDFSVTFSCADGLCIALADGHGSRKHFRSGLGAEMACGAVRQTLESLSVQAQPDEIKAAIIAEWRNRVRKHLAENPWSEEELNEQRSLLSEKAFARLISGETAEIAYGSTLLFAVVTMDSWLVMQLGDGGVAAADADGRFYFPLSAGRENPGNCTASLAMDAPMDEFRHYSEKGIPALIALYTDGVEKAFPRRSLALTRFLHEVCGAARMGGQQALRDCAVLLAEESSVRDDTSIGLLVDMDADIPLPSETDEQKGAELQRLKASVQECEGTLVYLKRVLAQQECGSDTALNLQAMIERKQSELYALKDLIEKNSGGYHDPDVC